MPHARTTNIRFEDAEYFTADLDSGAVRIGLKGYLCYDVPCGHAYFNRIAEATSRVVVEDLYDELFTLLEIQ